MPEELRWREFRDQITEFRYESLGGFINNHTRYYIFNGLEENTNYHYSRFSDQQNVENWVFPTIGHNVAKILKRDGILGDVIDTCIRDSDVSKILEQRYGAYKHGRPLHDYSVVLQEAAMLEKYDASSALWLYRNALELFPNSIGTLLRISRVELKLGHFENAIQSVETAIELFPEEAQLHLHMGKVLNWTQQWEKAEGAFNQAVRICADLSDAHYHLSVTLMHLGRHSASKSAAAEAARLGHSAQSSVWV